MAITQATSSVLAANAALNNLNAGASITFTKPLTVADFTLSAGSTVIINATTYSYGSGAATAHRTALGLTTLATTTPGANVATFLTTPTSSNLAAAVSDETGTGSLVFGTSPNFSGTPKINSNWIPQTLYKNGTIPVPQIFDDFHQGGNGSSTIGANNWTSSGTGSNGQWTISSSSTTTRAWGMQFFTTGATSGNTRSLTLGPGGGQVATTCVGASFQTCFSLLSATNFQYFNGFTGGGAGPGVSLSGIGVGATQLILTGPGITNVVLLSGLTINTGNFGFGTRYRLFYRCISTTQSEVYFASAPFDSATWTTIYDNPVNHGTLSLGFGCSIPVVSLVTLEGVAKTTYVDWASVIWDQQR